MMDGQVNEAGQMDGQMDVRADRQVGRWVVGQVDGWVRGKGWMNRQTYEMMMGGQVEMDGVMADRLVECVCVYVVCMCVRMYVCMYVGSQTFLHKILKQNWPPSDILSFTL